MFFQKYPLLDPPIGTDHCDWLYGIFGHETSCTRYWTCWNGTATEQLCIGGLLYNERTHSCDWPENVDGCQKHREFSCPVSLSNFSNAFLFQLCAMTILMETFHWENPATATGSAKEDIPGFKGVLLCWCLIDVLLGEFLDDF